MNLSTSADISTNTKKIQKKRKKRSCITCHMSPITCHLSHVTFHMSPVTCLGAYSVKIFTLYELIPFQSFPPINHLEKDKTIVIHVPETIIHAIVLK